MNDTATSRAIRIIVPLSVGLAFLAGWEAIVAIYDIKPFVLPAPSAVFGALVDNWATLMASTWATLKITALAFLLALVGGVGLAVLFSQSRLLELALFPYAVTLQVTPVVAIAPLVLIWVGLENIETALLILAWIVAFFPILSNTTLGLKSTDPNLRELFKLYGASRWHVLMRLQLPNALPYILAGMKISGWFGAYWRRCGRVCCRLRHSNRPCLAHC